MIQNDNEIFDISTIKKDELDHVKSALQINLAYKKILESFSKDLSTTEKQEIFEIAKGINEIYCQEQEKMEQVMHDPRFSKIPLEVNNKIFEINTRYSLYVTNSLLKLKSYDFQKFDINEFKNKIEKEYIDIKQSLYFFIVNYLEKSITKKNFNFSETYRWFNEVFYDGLSIRNFNTMGDIIYAFLESYVKILTDSEKMFLELTEKILVDFQKHLSLLEDMEEFDEFLPLVDKIYKNACQAYAFFIENKSDDPYSNYENAKRFYEEFSYTSNFFETIKDTYSKRLQGNFVKKIDSPQNQNKNCPKTIKKTIVE